MQSYEMSLLEHKLSRFRSRAPLFYEFHIEEAMGLISLSIPDYMDEPLLVPIDFSLEVPDIVHEVREAVRPFFPNWEHEGRHFYIDKVSFRKNTFLIRQSDNPEVDWFIVYKMRKPVSVLLKALRNKNLSPEEKATIFYDAIKEPCAEGAK